ncbi:hypothetical protein ACFOON_16890 [Novosphingobium piscinae]|uniref:Uncharacterized protein n=1 Tax=Novosphingobium piscinae TaxID=1507448 RepID=A0A7X1FYT6_9SPHN|nr:hypothetical protein [Novosphingobium piscinae]MBC2669468.1 hypothetical protein [Novosphingobium piscinae]
MGSNPTLSAKIRAFGQSHSYFGGYDVGRFDYAGFFDRRERTARVLSTIIGKPITAELHLNRTPGRHAVTRGEIVADHQLMSRLRDTLQEDIRFYEMMRVRWG